jgi:hypothetical protein
MAVFILLWSLCVKAADTTVTLQVPEGTNNHGDPHLLCTPTQWTDVLVFLLANYVTHIITITSRAGETTYSFVVRSIAAFLCPFFGVGEGVEAILAHAIFVKDPLQRAARAKALCMLVRGENWKPHIEDTIDGIVFSSMNMIYKPN